MDEKRQIRPHPGSSPGQALHTSTRPYLTALSLAIVLVIVLAMEPAKAQVVDEPVPRIEEADAIFQQALDALEAEDYAMAYRRFRFVYEAYPVHRKTTAAILMGGKALYRFGDYPHAVDLLTEFIRTYPTHPNVDYAYYLKGLVNFEQNLGFLEKMMPARVRDRDQSMAVNSFMDFSELIRRFPDSRYVPDARQRMIFLRNNLAAYEITVAEYYRHFRVGNRAALFLIRVTFDASIEIGPGRSLTTEDARDGQLPELRSQATILDAKRSVK